MKRIFTFLSLAILLTITSIVHAQVKPAASSTDTTIPNYSMELPVLIPAADKKIFLFYKN